MSNTTKLVSNYDESAIRSLEWKEHIRLRPGMYIGKLGDGSSYDDGIYVLLKEVLDNSIDEHTMGFGKQINISISDKEVIVRDFGRGIPLGKVVDCVSKMNTGGKYDSKVFQKAVGLNGVGTKAVNALSSAFSVESFREGSCKKAVFTKGELIEDKPRYETSEKNGTRFTFHPDEEIFKNYQYKYNYIYELIWNYCYLNSNLTIKLNNKKYKSENGLKDLLDKKVDDNQRRYPLVHLQDEDIEVALTHTNQYGEEYYSFVNGQYTTQGGTHLAALKETVVKTVRDFFGKSFDAVDIRQGIVVALAIRVQEPVFESQTKTKLGSANIAPDGPTVRTFINDFFKKHFDDYLHKNNEVAEELRKRILQSERERKEIAGVKKLANERAKKANIHNKKLRDCHFHYNDKKGEYQNETCIFITEGDSASGSLTKSRNPKTQAVFSLRGKPLNTFGKTKKIVYENEEFNLLQHALNIENGIEGLRYKKIIVATDADVDGMHIRLLLLTFFLQFFPELVRQGHIFILETPLFRVRNKKETIYCYSDEERQNAIMKLGQNPEITRFKGLGEISPDEFAGFIGDNIRLEPALLNKETELSTLLPFYMGSNTPERQNFIIDNLKIERDLAEQNT